MRAGKISVPQSFSSALMGGNVYFGTLDGHLIALDATTGKKAWDVVGVHDTINASYTMSPVPYKNVLLLGASNGDRGGSLLGHISAICPRSP